jgi:hypothetical protein
MPFMNRNMAFLRISASENTFSVVISTPSITDAGGWASTSWATDGPAKRRRIPIAKAERRASRTAGLGRCRGVTDLPLTIAGEPAERAEKIVVPRLEARFLVAFRRDTYIFVYFGKKTG